MAKFKNGDKIVCISTKKEGTVYFYGYITIGNIYTCQLYYNRDIYLENKNDVCLKVIVLGHETQMLYPEDNFVSLSEYRKMKLKNIEKLETCEQI